MEIEARLEVVMSIGLRSRVILVKLEGLASDFESVGGALASKG